MTPGPPGRTQTQHDEFKITTNKITRTKTTLGHQHKQKHIGNSTNNTLGRQNKHIASPKQHKHIEKATKKSSKIIQKQLPKALQNHACKKCYKNLQKVHPRPPKPSILGTPKWGQNAA